MDASLALTALLMGLAGGPHCVAMCGVACGALGPGLGRGPGADAEPGRVMPLALRPPPDREARLWRMASAAWLFQFGRLLSYTALGVAASSSMQAVAWLSAHAAALRPVWALMHVAAAVLGLVLLWQARQPAWLEEGARSLWQGVQSVMTRSAGPAGARYAAPLLMGLSWGFLPCGLLYSALLVAALSPGPWQGAGVMLLFALGSSLSLVAGPWLWRRLRGAESGQWAVRLAGAALLVLSLWALWMGLVHDTAPWCVPASAPPA